MISLTFVCEENENSGELGWRPENQDRFDPYGSMAVVHDLMEHFHDTTDAPHHEFMALGCGMWLRGEGSFWHILGGIGSKDYAYNFSGDFGDIYQRYAIGDCPDLIAPPKYTRLREGEDEITRCIEFARRGIIGEWIRGNGQTPEEEAQEIAQADEFLKRAAEWMRRGWRRAKRRYRGLSNYELSYLFVNMMKKVEALEKANSLGELIEGDKMTVRIKPREYTGEAILHRNEEENEV